MVTAQTNIGYLILGIFYVAEGVFICCLAMRWTKYEPTTLNVKDGVEKEFYFSSTGDLWYMLKVFHNNELIKLYNVHQSESGFVYDNGDDLISTPYISKDLTDSLFIKAENYLKTY